MLMGQAKILTAHPGFEGCLVAPRGKNDIGGLRIGWAEYLQTHKARLLVDLTRPGSEPLLELLTPWRCDRNTIGDNVHTFLLASAKGQFMIGSRDFALPEFPGTGLDTLLVCMARELPRT